MRVRESVQVRKEAALSGSGHVPRTSLTRASHGEHARGPLSKTGPHGHFFIDAGGGRSLNGSPLDPGSAPGRGNRGDSVGLRPPVARLRPDAAPDRVGRHLLVDGPALIPPGGAGLDERTQQIARRAGVGRAGSAQYDLERPVRVAVSVATHIRDQLDEPQRRAECGRALPTRTIGTAPSHRAARRIGRRCGQYPPIQIGTRGRCTGVGSRLTS